MKTDLHQSIADKATTIVSHMHTTDLLQEDLIGMDRHLTNMLVLLTRRDVPPAKRKV